MTDKIFPPSSNIQPPAQPAHQLGEVSDWGSSIPQNYGITRIVLMPRDPRFLYAYWEVTEETANSIKSRYGQDIFSQTQPTIRRILIINGMETDKIDLSVPLEARNWYMQVEEEGSSWVVEIGLKQNNANFIVLARSNRVTLPKGQMSRVTDEKWAELQTQMEEFLTHSGGKLGGADSLELSKRLAERWRVLIQGSSWSNQGGISSSLVSAIRKT